MVKFGSYTLPHVLSVTSSHLRVRQNVPQPGRPFAYRKDRGGLGAQFTVAGEIRPYSQLARDELLALADGTPRILDLEDSDLTLLSSCLLHDGAAWTDDTPESQSPGGTPFNLLELATDYRYFGHREKFNKLRFDFATVGSYEARLWEYSQGDGAWDSLIPTSDGTSGFSQDGDIELSPPSDWKQDTVNAITNRFWLRVSAAGVTTIATVNQIELNNVYYCILGDPVLNRSAIIQNRLPYTLTFYQSENP